MNKALLNKILPHFLVILAFLAISVIYCYPALEGKVVNQNDITHWKGANKDRKSVV